MNAVCFSAKLTGVRCNILYLFLFLVLISTCCDASQTRKVLIIGVDGCRSDALQQANTPTIDSLIVDGLFTYDSWHLGITISGPSWSTIMTGTWWNKHGVKSNSYANSNFNSYPYFTKRAKELKPNLKCIQVAEWEPLTNDVYNDGMDAKIITANGGDSTTTECLRQLQDTALDCLFAYYEAVDRAGHASGFSPGNSNYIASIEYVDEQVALLMQGLKNRANFSAEDWLVLLVTDHGGISLAHGGNSWSERHIWWIASGNAITPRQIAAADPGTYNFLATGIFNSVGVNKPLMRQSPVHTDIATTALHHLIYDTGINPETQTSWKLDGKSWLDNTIGLVEISEEQTLKIFPNPGNGLVSLWFNNPNKEIVAVEICDIAGRLVKQFDDMGTVFKVNLNLSALRPGTYIAKIKTGDKVCFGKIEIVK